MSIHNAQSINIFFSLLRSGLYGRPVPQSELPAAIDWEAVTTLGKMHAVLGILIESVQFLPAPLRPSGEMMARLGKYALGQIQANLVLDQAAARLVRFLADHDLSGVLLKGQGVARYYRVPQMRHSGDVDFYVGRKAYKRAVELCRENLCDDKEDCGETDQHFTFDMGGVPIEIHRIASRVYSPVRNRRFQQWVEYELHQSPSRRTFKVGNTDITIPSYDFDAIFIFYHAWRHYILGGIGLRQLCDWAMIFHTHGRDIDRPRLIENIRRFGITQGWKLFASIAVDHLGLSPDEMPLYEPSYSPKSENILAEILEGGSFGHYTEAYNRVQGKGLGVRYGLEKIRSVTGYFVSLFPLIPAEATFLYIYRLYSGAISMAKRAKSQKRLKGPKKS